MYDDVKIELKQVKKTLTRLDYIREKGRIRTLQRIKMIQDEERLKELEKQIVDDAEKKAPEKKAPVKKG